MKNQLKLILLFSLTLTLGSCITSFNGVKGNSNVVTEVRKIDADFNSIDSSHGLQVIVIPSTKPEVSVEADENLQEIIKTEVSNGVLRVYSERNIWQAKSRKVYVKTPVLTSVDASSGSSIRSKSMIKTENFSASSSSGSSINLIINAQAVLVDASSGSNIELEGKAKSIIAEASSGSSIRCGNLNTQDATAKVSSGANIRVHSSSHIKARASSGGGIRYSGNPEYIDRDTSSGGSISGS